MIDQYYCNYDDDDDYNEDDDDDDDDDYNDEGDDDDLIVGAGDGERGRSRLGSAEGSAELRTIKIKTHIIFHDGNHTIFMIRIHIFDANSC